MPLEKGFIWVNDVEASAAVPPEGHIVYARDTDTHLASDGTTLTAMGGGGGGLDTEGAQDAVGAMVDASLTYDDATPLLKVTEMTGDVTSTGANVTTIANDAVTFAKIQNITDNRLLGRSAGSTGDAQHITPSTGTYLSSAVLKTYRFGMLDYKSGAADTPDDDFDAGSLDAKWTAVTGTSGTVDIFEAGAAITRYDLTTRSGWLLMQTGKNTGSRVNFRQDYTLPDGSSIVAAFAVNTAGSSSAVPTNNASDFGISVNSTDTDPITGTYCSVYMDGQTNTGPRVLVLSSVGSTLSGPDNFSNLGSMVYLRIARVGTIYHCLCSSEFGTTWYHLGSKDLGGAADNVWIWSQCDATFTGLVPVVGCDWFRLGTNALDPW